MNRVLPKFADSSSGGISSLGINLKGFIFQLITFLIVLLILRRWVFPRLVATLEARRKTLEESLIQAKQTEEALARAEEKASNILHKARTQADLALKDAQEQARAILAKAEEAARQQSEQLLQEARDQIEKEHEKLRGELKGELVNLVALATENVLRTKLSTQEDEHLIELSIKELVK